MAGSAPARKGSMEFLLRVRVVLLILWTIARSEHLLESVPPGCHESELLSDEGRRVESGK